MGLTHTHLHRTPDFIAASLKKTGILPFTRSAHLEKNRADIQLGDALIAAERMLQNDRKREAESVRVIDSPLPDNQATVSPIRLSEIGEISATFGAHEQDNDETPEAADKHGLRLWPKYDATRRSTTVWCRCFECSPQVKARFDITSRDELKKFFGVGLLLEDDIEKISAEQAVVLGYFESIGRNHLCSNMILQKLNDLHAEEPRDLRSIVKHSKALTTATQHQMPNGEAAALLDLTPGGNVSRSHSHSLFLSLCHTHTHTHTHMHR